MSDDSETVEDTEKGSLAEVTDDLCTVEFPESGPNYGASDDYHTPEFVYPVFIHQEDLLDVKQEPADESDDEFPDYSVKQEPSDDYETDASCSSVEVSLHTHIQ